jgi:hypothetical protein
MFNRFYIYIYKLLLKGLPTYLFCRYILESWKKITANATITVKSPTKLFCRYILESWERITTNATVTHLQNYWWRESSVFFCGNGPSIIFFINDGLTDRPEIYRRLFFRQTISVRESIRKIITDEMLV